MKSAADKYINSKIKKQMQEGGEMQQAPQPEMQATMQIPVEELNDDNSYEVEVEDDSGLIKYRFSKDLTI